MIATAVATGSAPTPQPNTLAAGDAAKSQAIVDPTKKKIYHIPRPDQIRFSKQNETFYAVTDEGIEFTFLEDDRDVVIDTTKETLSKMKYSTISLLPPQSGFLNGTDDYLIYAQYLSGKAKYTLIGAVKGKNCKIPGKKTAESNSISSWEEGIIECEE